MMFFVPYHPFHPIPTYSERTCFHTIAAVERVLLRVFNPSIAAVSPPEANSDKRQLLYVELRGGCARNPCFGDVVPVFPVDRLVFSTR